MKRPNKTESPIFVLFYVFFVSKGNLLDFYLTLLLRSTTCPILANSVDLDQLPSESALFVIKYVNFYQKSGSSNLIGWKFEVGVAS